MEYRSQKIRRFESTDRGSCRRIVRRLSTDAVSKAVDNYLDKLRSTPANSDLEPLRNI